MELDNTTYTDLSVFQHEEEFSIFHRLSFTLTSQGRDWLLKFFSNPFKDIKPIQDTQQIIKLITANMDQWPVEISNGSLMVIEKFYDSNIDAIPNANLVQGFIYKLVNGPDFSLVRYSLSHFSDLLKGMHQLVQLLDTDEAPMMIRAFLRRAADLINKPVLHNLRDHTRGKQFTLTETLHYGGYIRDQFRHAAHELIAIYGRIDAWYSMAVATQKFGLTIPEFVDQKQPIVDARQLWHILLPVPVPYDVRLNPDNNFLFLTGANMAGKSTFIKAVGSTVFLAHLGMGVPAKQMRLTLFDGLLTNINVVDNIIKGESYFFNEVQRIKNTIMKINDGRKWLVLIDELFKGTNVQDAMKCSSVVIKGLIKIKSSLFILSTHLYEIGEELKEYPNISFRFFETTAKDDQLEFSYQLKEGISNDRLGYLILRREKVVDMLEKL